MKQNLINIFKRSPRLYRFLKFFYLLFCRLIYLKMGRYSIRYNNELISVLPDHQNTFWGYYDRMPINGKGHMLIHTVDDGLCRIWVLDTDRTVLSMTTTAAWNWQQGSLPTWINDSHFIFNDIAQGIVSTLIYDTDSERVVFDMYGTYQSYSPESDTIAFINNDKLKRFRRDYAFDGSEMLLGSNELCAFFSLVSHENGTFSAERICTFEKILTDNNVVGEKINHVVFSPKGEYALALRRYWIENQKYHRLELLKCDGQLELLIENEIVSHYCWLNNYEIVYWGTYREVAGYHLLDIRTKVIYEDYFKLGSCTDGHPTIADGGFYIDTYPDRSGYSNLSFVDQKRFKRIDIAKFWQPLFFDEVKRIDLHPKYHANSGCVLLDSGHSGKRQAYICKMKKSTNP